LNGPLSGLYYFGPTAVTVNGNQLIIDGSKLTQVNNSITISSIFSAGLVHIAQLNVKKNIVQ